jgi:Flp pilus assembly protein TadD
VSRPADELHAEAMRLANEGQGREAAAVLEKMVMQYADNALGHNDLGVLHYQLGDKEGARRAYERAVELQPANANFRKNLADLYFTDFGMTDEAIRIYLELFREQPRDIETLAGLGHICAAISRPEEAKSFYRRALEIEPWNIDTRNALQELERT